MEFTEMEKQMLYQQREVSGMPSSRKYLWPHGMLGYTTKGLACICRDGVDSIASALKELEKHGYLTRQRVRFDNGRLGILSTRYMKSR